MAEQQLSHTLTEHQAAHYISMSRSWLAQARMRGDPKAPPFLK
ncbi:MAG: DNA-binding protein, partial [Alphaproteobacteria bacterium]|nr:DNA-binding protein [Alphaproteobacteria bacterium]